MRSPGRPQKVRTGFVHAFVYNPTPSNPMVKEEVKPKRKLSLLVEVYIRVPNTSGGAVILLRWAWEHSDDDPGTEYHHRPV